VTRQQPPRRWRRKIESNFETKMDFRLSLKSVSKLPFMHGMHGVMSLLEHLIDLGGWPNIISPLVKEIIM
jgi:hypothetical protein